MNTLDRYILRETLRPFMVTLVLALMAQHAFDKALASIPNA